MATKYTKEEIQKALAEDKRPENMTRSYWSALKRGKLGKCYGLEASAPEAKKVPEETAEVETTTGVEDDSEQTTTVVESDGTVRIISSSSV